MSYIDNTFVAWASTAKEHDPAGLEAALERVFSHYDALCAESLLRESDGDARSGMAMLHPKRDEMRWPIWSASPELTVTSTNAIVGWRRVTGRATPERAPLELGRRLLDSPALAGQLNPPFSIAIRDPRRQKMMIVNDALGGARLYEMATPELTVWTNRIGAAVLFAGVTPRADEEAWAMLGACGWFPGSSTPYQGVKKVDPGSAIEVDTSGGDVRVGGRQLGLLEPIVTPRKPKRFLWARQAVAQLRDTAEDIGEIWTVEPTLNISGGRDSRVVAAAVLSVGTKMTYRTMDIDPGEADVARELLRVAPGEFQHQVTQPERKEPADTLRERIGNSHLVHDGNANPMSLVQAGVKLPQESSEKPLVGGHGGELGHGFYYSRKALKKLRAHNAGPDEFIDRLDKSNATTSDARERSRAAIRAALDEGIGYGIEGPTLLDFYYLRERLPYRAGLGNRNDRYAPCVAPAYLRAAFDLTPEERTRARLHRAVVAKLMPVWKDVEFFHGSGGPLNRARIWERGAHADALAEMLEDSSAWGTMFEPDRVRKMWIRARAGESPTNYEHVFMRIASRSVFDDHLGRLSPS